MPVLAHALVLSVLTQAALKDKPQGVLIETVKFFQTLIANLDARFLSQQAVNKPLVRLIRHCVGDEDVDSAWGEDIAFEDSEEDTGLTRSGASDAVRFDEVVVGLMAFVASKLYGSQELLHIFFHDRQKDKNRSRRVSSGSMDSRNSGSTQRPPSPALSQNSSTATVRANGPSVGQEAPRQATPEDSAKSFDFPLFTYLLRFVHAEGQAGQLARAGLAVIVKIAFEAKPLEVSDDPRSSYRRVRFTQEEGADSLASDIAEYILQSDFVDVIGASLGAVYGLLPSKLDISAPSADELSETATMNQPTVLAPGGMSLGVKSNEAVREERSRNDRLGIESSNSPHIAERLQLFVDILNFLQFDVLTKAIEASSLQLGRKAMIAHQLVGKLSDSVRLSLMNNIISPSMVESGDRDGSAVAVMSYLEVLLCTLQDHSPLAEDVAGWLVKEDIDTTSLASRQSKDGASVIGRRQKSAALLLLQRGNIADDNTFDPLLQYTIKNLISDHLAPTTTSASVAAALGLANAFLARHGRFALYGLIDVQADEKATQFPRSLEFRKASDVDGITFLSDDDSIARAEDNDSSKLSTAQARVSLSHHEWETELYGSLVLALNVSSDGQIDSNFADSTDFANYVKDADAALSTDSTYTYGLHSSLATQSSMPQASRPTGSWLDGSQSLFPQPHGFAPFRHHLDPRDVLLRSVLSRLRRFFEQSVEVNVALTSLIATISLCPYRNMEGWLTFPPQESPKASAQTPVLLEVVRCLVQQVQVYRSQIPDFDSFLNERRRGLLYVENLSDALAAASPMTDHNQDREPSPNNTTTDEPYLFSSLSGEGKDAACSELWESTVGNRWPGASFTESQDGANDAQVVDARAMRLPPRPSDASSNASEPSEVRADPRVSKPGSGFLSNSTMHRLFGRSLKVTEVPKTDASSAQTTESVDPSTATPFADHYAETSNITLEPLFVPMPAGPWSSSRSTFKVAGLNTESDGHREKQREKRTRFQLSPRPSKSSTQSEREAESDRREEGVLLLAYPGLDEDEQEEARRSRGRITLSCLLDNVVILQEFIKQLTAIIVVRRSVGIEQIDLSRT